MAQKAGQIVTNDRFADDRWLKPNVLQLTPCGLTMQIR